MDKLTPESRSKNMAAVKSRNTKPELKIRKMLFAQGFRYRLYNQKLPGKPDICLHKYNAVIFIHGCFWHGHCGCNKASLPKTRQEFWRRKIETNRLRDKHQIRELHKLGIRVLIIWTCACRPKLLPVVLRNTVNWLHGNLAYAEIAADSNQNVIYSTGLIDGSI